MKCPLCKSRNTGCTDSRWRPTYNVIRRRRYCKDCQHRWSTQEVLVPDGARNMVVVSARAMAEMREIIDKSLAGGNCLDDEGNVIALKRARHERQSETPAYAGSSAGIER